MGTPRKSKSEREKDLRDRGLAEAARAAREQEQEQEIQNFRVQQSKVTPEESLRDRFAMAALQGLFALEVDENENETPEHWADRMASSAYLFANAMMERRKR